MSEDFQNYMENIYLGAKVFGSIVVAGGLAGLIGVIYGSFSKTSRDYFRRINDQNRDISREH